MEVLIGAISALSALLVAVINNIFMMRTRKNDDVAGRLDRIEKANSSLNDKIDLGNQGTMTNLKLQLEEIHDKQYDRVSSVSGSWSKDIDRAFREAYVIYKNLGGNGVVDRIKDDMDIWRDENANDAYIFGKAKQE